MKEAGVIPPLITLLEEGSDRAKEQAAGALLNLAVNPVNQVHIAECNGIHVLTKLLANSSDSVKTLVAGTLRNLAANEQNRVGIANAGAIPELVILLHESALPGKIQATSALARLAMDRWNKSLIANSGAIEVLESMMEASESMQFKIEAARAFNNLAVGSHDNKVYLAEAGAIYPLVQLLHNGTVIGKKTAANALWNIAFDHERYLNGEALTGLEGIIPLVSLLTKYTDQAKEQATEGLEALCVGTARQQAIAEAGAIPILVDMIAHGTDKCKEHAAGLLKNLLIHNAANKIAIAEEGAILPFLALLREGTEYAKRQAGAAVWGLAFDDVEDHPDILTEAGEVLPLVHLLKNGNDLVKEQVARSLGTLAYSDDANRASIVEAGAIPPLVQLLQTGTGAAKEWAVSALGTSYFPGSSKYYCFRPAS